MSTVDPLVEDIVEDIKNTMAMVRSKFSHLDDIVALLEDVEDELIVTVQVDVDKRLRQADNRARAELALVVALLKEGSTANFARICDTLEDRRHPLADAAIDQLRETTRWIQQGRTAAVLVGGSRCVGSVIGRKWSVWIGAESEHVSGESETYEQARRDLLAAAVELYGARGGARG